MCSACSRKAEAAWLELHLQGRRVGDRVQGLTDGRGPCTELPDGEVTESAEYLLG